MILAQHIGTEGWAGVPNLFYNKKVSMKIVLGFLVSMLGLYIMLR
jgi:hypothetical protein